jgi:hypothetical protein
MQEKKCELCNKPYKTYFKEQKYCGMRCAGLARTLNAQAKKNAPVNPVKRKYVKKTNWANIIQTSFFAFLLNIFVVLIGLIAYKVFK